MLFDLLEYVDYNNAYCNWRSNKLKKQNIFTP